MHAGWCVIAAHAWRGQGEGQMITRGTNEEKAPSITRKKLYLYMISQFIHFPLRQLADSVALENKNGR